MMKEGHASEVFARVSKSAEIQLNAMIDEVFPLFTPLEEMKWVQGWKPRFVYPANGEAEEQMIFVTPPRFDGEGPYCWIMSTFDRQDYHVEYVVFAEDRVWNIRVICVPNGSTTRAKITYQFTSLTDRGRERNDAALRQMYGRDLKDWEEAINEYLAKQTDSALPN